MNELEEKVLFLKNYIQDHPVMMISRTPSNKGFLQEKIIPLEYWNKLERLLNDAFSKLPDRSEDAAVHPEIEAGKKFGLSEDQLKSDFEATKRYFSRYPIKFYDGEIIKDPTLDFIDSTCETCLYEKRGRCIKNSPRPKGAFSFAVYPMVKTVDSHYNEACGEYRADIPEDE